MKRSDAKILNKKRHEKKRKQVEREFSLTKRNHHIINRVPAPPPKNKPISLTISVKRQSLRVNKNDANYLESINIRRIKSEPGASTNKYIYSRNNSRSIFCLIDCK